MENHINIFIVSKVLSIYRFERIRAGESRVRKRPRGRYTIFGGGCRARFRPRIQPRTKALSINSVGAAERETRTLIHEFRWDYYGSCEKNREREMKRQREIRGEARAFTSLARVYFLRETIEGNLFPGCFHDCLLPLLFSPAPGGFGESIVLITPTQSSHTCVQLNFERGESVLTSIAKVHPDAHATTTTIGRCLWDCSFRIFIARDCADSFRSWEEFTRLRGVTSRLYR